MQSRKDKSVGSQLSSFPGKLGTSQ